MKVSLIKVCLANFSWLATLDVCYCYYYCCCCCHYFYYRIAFSTYKMLIWFMIRRPHKMQKRNQCLFLRIKISLIGHFNKPVFESFLDELLVFFLPISNVYCFLFRKLHNKNVKIVVLKDLKMKIFFLPRATLLGSSQQEKYFS